MSYNGWGKPWYDVNQYNADDVGPAPWYVPLHGDPLALSVMHTSGGTARVDLSADFAAMGGMPSTMLTTNLPPTDGEIDVSFDLMMDGQQDYSRQGYPSWYMSFILAYVPPKWRDSLDAYSSVSEVEIQFYPDRWAGAPGNSDWYMTCFVSNSAVWGSGYTYWPVEGHGGDGSGAWTVTPWLGVWHRFHIHFHLHGWWANFWPRDAPEPHGGTWGDFGESFTSEVTWPTADGTLPGFNVLGPVEIDTLTWNVCGGGPSGAGTLYVDNVCWGREAAAAPVVFGGDGYP